MTNMKVFHLTNLYLLCISLLYTASASLAEPSKTPCQDDLQKFCKDIPSEKGQKAKCLRSHLDKLSPGCKKKLDEMKKKTKEAKLTKKNGEEPKAEISESCKGVKLNDPQFKECMKERMEIMKSKFKKIRDQKMAEQQNKIKDANKKAEPKDKNDKKE